MPDFGGVDHASLSVTELYRSHLFYTEVLGFVMLMDLSQTRLYLHQETGFILGCTNTTSVPAARSRS